MLPGLIVSALALAVALYFVDVRELVQALRLADYRFIIAGLSLSVGWLIVRAFFWRTLLQERAPFKEVFFTLTEGYLLNNIFPFRLGEVGRAFLLSRKTPLTFWQILSTIVVERLFDVAFGVGLLLVSLPFVVGGEWARGVALVSGVIVLAGLFTLFLVARNQGGVLSIFERISLRFHFLQRFRGTLQSLLEGISVFNSFSRFLKATGWETLNWGIAALQYLLFMKAFFPHAQLIWVTFTMSVNALGAAAPSSPGAIGVYEAVITGALKLFDPNTSAAFAYAVTMHLSGYLINGILGAFALARDGETLSGLYKSAREMLAFKKEASR